MSDGEEKTPAEQAVEHAVDLFVYAPIGLLFEGASLLPQLVEKGKQQVVVARMMGKFAVDQLQGQATKAASKLQDQTAGVLDFLGDSVTPLSTDDPAPERPAASALPRRAPEAPASPADVAEDGIGAGELAIPDYDGLSASQVVNRLAGLSVEELSDVQRYERAHRGRKTILSKVAQLQAR